MRSRVSAPTTIAAGVRLTVVGDVMLDEYIFGDAHRISPEAPVPVVHARGERRTPGGAAHSAHNAVALKAAVQLCAVVGADATAGELERLLSEAGVNVTFVSSAARQTIRKTRVFAGHHQVARIDYETVGALDHDDERALAAVIGAVAATDVILVSDYAKGSVTEAVMSEVRSLAQTHAATVVVDPKASDWSLYRGVDVLKPNAAELGRASGMPTGTPSEIVAAGIRMSAQMSPTAVVVTRGASGMSLFIDGHHVLDDAAITRDVIDVTGAGDTVAVCIALARASAIEWPAALRLANLAAGIAIRRAGTTVVSLDELESEAGHD
jgi:D-beta-D-heptose 7-phosphate kinase/D-beta-D-heptose 1-phosphate adenosyltransferase